MGFRRRGAKSEPMAQAGGRSRTYAGVRRVEPRLVTTRVPLRGLHDLLRLHAGGRAGERSHHGLLPLPVGGAPDRAAREAPTMSKPGSGAVSLMALVYW